MRPTHRTVAAALLLTAAASAQSEDAGVCLVIRHDPDLIRLHQSLLQPLVSGQRYHALIDRMPLRADAQVYPKIVSIGDPAAQPPGVFTARLRIVGELGPEARQTLTDAVVGLLRESLQRLLADGPSKQLEAERTRALRELDATERRLAAIVREKQKLAGEDSDALRSVQRDLAEELRRVRIEIESQESVLHKMQDLAKDARTAMQDVRDRHQQALLRTNDLAAAIVKIKWELDAAREAERIEKLEQLAATETANLDSQKRVGETLEREAAQISVRVRDLEQQLEQTTVELHGLRSRHEAMTAQLADTTARIQASHKDDGQRAALGLEAETLQQTAAAHRQRATELAARVARLRSIHVEVWR